MSILNWSMLPQSGIPIVQPWLLHLKRYRNLHSESALESGTVTNLPALSTRRLYLKLCSLTRRNIPLNLRNSDSLQFERPLVQTNAYKYSFFSAHYCYLEHSAIRHSTLYFSLVIQTLFIATLKFNLTFYISVYMYIIFTCLVIGCTLMLAVCY